MKRFFYLIFSLILAAGCAASTDVSLTVSVESPVADNVVIVYHNDVQEVSLDENGSASFAISGVDAAYLTLYHGREALKLYVEGGDNISLTFKGRNLMGTYALQGGKPEAVKYLNTVRLIPLPDEDYALPFDEYKSRLEDKEKDALRLLKAGNLSSEGKFVAMEESRIKYSYGAALMMYPVGHMLMAEDFTYVPGEDYYDFVATYVVEDEFLANLDEYREFIAEAMHLLDVRNRNLSEVYPKTVAQMKYAADNLSNPKVKEVMMHHMATVYSTTYTGNSS